MSNEKINTNDGSISDSNLTHIVESVYYLWQRIEINLKEVVENYNIICLTLPVGLIMKAFNNIANLKF